MAKKTPAFVYGQSPNPTNWHEAANAIRATSKHKKAKKPSMFEEKMSSLEKLIKESRHAV